MSTARVNLWKVPGIADTALARRYSKLPPERNPKDASDFVWVPISIIEHTSRNIGGHHIVTLPNWFVEKEGL